MGDVENQTREGICSSQKVSLSRLCSDLLWCQKTLETVLWCICKWAGCLPCSSNAWREWISGGICLLHTYCTRIELYSDRKWNFSNCIRCSQISPIFLWKEFHTCNWSSPFVEDIWWKEGCSTNCCCSMQGRALLLSVYIQLQHWIHFRTVKLQYRLYVMIATLPW